VRVAPRLGPPAFGRKRQGGGCVTRGGVREVGSADPSPDGSALVCWYPCWFVV
jgi:hypothetical protein